MGLWGGSLSAVQPVSFAHYPPTFGHSGRPLSLAPPIPSSRSPPPSSSPTPAFPLDPPRTLTPRPLPLPHTRRTTALHNHLLERSSSGEMERMSIDEAVQLYREALSVCPPPHPDRAPLLSNLAASLLERFQQRGDGADIDEAIQLYREALPLCPPPHPTRAPLLNNLAASVIERFQQRGAAADIDDAIELYREALSLRSPSHPDRAGSLSNLAASVLLRFQHRGNGVDLDEVIELYREAVSLRPPPHPDRAPLLSNTAASVLLRFQHRENGVDLDEVIELYREAVSLRPPPHPDRAPLLSNMAASVLLRFQHRGNGVDLDEVIELYREAASLRLPPHPDCAPLLSNMAASVIKRFPQRGDGADIDDAIELYHEALSLRSPPHPDHAGLLNNQAASVIERFQQRGAEADIDEAVQLNREVLSLCPQPHPYRAPLLSNLAAWVTERFQQRGMKADIDEAVQLHREAVSLRPPPHPERASSLISLAASFASTYKHTSLPTSLDSAILALQEASTYSMAPPLLRFQAARDWASMAHKNRHPLALEAYQIALELMPQVAALSLNLSSRQAIIAQSHSLGSDAAACAIQLGQYEIAIEFLEACRSVFWSRSLDLSTRLDDLRASHPVLADKLTELSWELELGSFRDASRNLQADSHHRVMSAEAEGVRFRKLNEEWDQTVEAVRSSVPGFEDFMQPKSMSKLRCAAEHGPVVILNTGELSCHALILNSLGTVQCVNLPEIITRKSVDNLAQIFRALVSPTVPFSAFMATLPTRGHDLESTHRLIGRLVYEKDSSPEDWFRRVLSILWTDVKSENPLRLWWCPTGSFSFLPIHAAGIYDEHSMGESVTDYVISSYTPTLEALLAPSFHPFAANSPARVTPIIQPNTPDSSSLPYTEDELRKIQEMIPTEWLASFGSAESRLSLDSVSHGAQSLNTDALLAALRQGHTEIVDLLVGNGADVNKILVVKDINGHNIYLRMEDCTSWEASI
ncbi:CHAT domain-containing protein [Mycena venus]|uniref:CHAT domain-containing protein n=1 Tax=Mycena venus TaxID=2733690 RepID=A0A8H7D1I7_9AGAR|nr:CHAT domain-containing protein [Mycena venus]